MKGVWMRGLVVAGALGVPVSAAAKPEQCKAQRDELATWLKQAAEKPTEVKPGPSSISKDLAELDASLDPKKKAPKLEKNAPNLPDRVFKKCAGMNAWMKTLSPLQLPEKRARIVAELPAQIEACGCQVEMPAVKELAYHWLNPAPPPTPPVSSPTK